MSILVDVKKLIGQISDMKTAKELLAFATENRSRLADEFIENVYLVCEASASRGLTKFQTKLKEGLFSHREYIGHRFTSLGYSIDFGAPMLPHDGTEETCAVWISWESKK